MVKRMLSLLFTLLLLSLGTGLCGAQSLDGQKPLPQPGGNAPRSKPVRMLTGTFINPAGQSHQIQVMDGGHLNITNKRENLYYQLHARTTEDGTAELTLEQYLDPEYSVKVAEEEMNVAFDGKSKRSSLAGFRIALDGERMTRAEYRPDYVLNKSIGGECCIDCGYGWEVCCGVEVFERGWMACCSIDTSCAWCEVCAWSY